MKIKSVQKKINRTPEELARLKAIREKFQQARPTLEQLVESGEYDPPEPLGAYLGTKELLNSLKKERANSGLSLTQVAERAGMDKAAVSRLENGNQTNPTVGTLWRYAMAVGKQIIWSFADFPDAGKKVEVATPAPETSADLPQDASAELNQLVRESVLRVFKNIPGASPGALASLLSTRREGLTEILVASLDLCINGGESNVRGAVRHLRLLRNLEAAKSSRPSHVPSIHRVFMSKESPSAATLVPTWSYHVYTSICSGGDLVYAKLGSPKLRGSEHLETKGYIKDYSSDRSAEDSVSNKLNADRKRLLRGMRREKPPFDMGGLTKRRTKHSPAHISDKPRLGSYPAFVGGN